MGFPLLIYRFKDSIFICYERERERERENVFGQQYCTFISIGSFQREITSTNRIENGQRTLPITTLMMFENI